MPLCKYPGSFSTLLPGLDLPSFLHPLPGFVQFWGVVRDIHRLGWASFSSSRCFKWHVLVAQRK